MMLTIWPLPDWAARFRPDWVALLVIYWCLAMPHRVGILTAWVAGVMVDALTGSLLGEHALALTVVAFLTLQSHLRLRLFPLWQQTVSVVAFLVVYQFLLLWIDGITGQVTGSWERLLPVLTSAVLWPWILNLLRILRRRYQSV
jgi:rod shape-determining protein MreD